MRGSVDVLSLVAETFRLRGSVGGVCSLASPWGYEMPSSDHAALLVVTRGRVHFELSSGKRPPLELAPGDVVAMPHGDGYAMRDDPRTPVRPFEEIKGSRDAGDRVSTEFVGMCCQLEGGRNNPFARALPPLIHCRGNDGHVVRWLEPTVRLLASEAASSTPGRVTVLNRLAEIVFVQLIRSWIDEVPDGAGGWLRALGDPQVGGALEAIHAEPGSPWTVASLAGRAGMSRSAFAERFRNLVGEAPLEYLTRWRMQKAASLLESGAASVKEVVATSGYASEAAFRVAFKKYMGAPPAAYRNERNGDA